MVYNHASLPQRYAIICHFYTFPYSSVRQSLQQFKSNTSEELGSHNLQNYFYKILRLKYVSWK